MEWLKDQEPVIVWDETSHKPELQTEEDWIKAGEIVSALPPAQPSTKASSDWLTFKA
jgi:hypothetical protein